MLLAGLGAVLAIGVVSVLVAVQRADGPAPATLNGVNVPAAPPPPVVTHVITYELSGTGTARNVTYVGKGAAIEQVAQAGAPWSVTVEGSAARYVSLTAQHAGEGTLTCHILVDGVAVSSSTVSTPEAMLRCSKSLD
ncbi:MULTISPECIES: MmpS family transport accessory protein [Amycolatopsis]|uniref:Membrane protein n=1 Tax=Amycolatopsis sacchari TaxID=115433 RepID=A0A1I3ZA29_9PSEU|nr:MmpS family transport accessory protein [Amycolatopsis sacchari]SFK40780.1 membrane protein [Amycolatopsis sacchari]